jgi:hypothetical protein
MGHPQQCAFLLNVTLFSSKYIRNQQIAQLGEKTLPALHHSDYRGALAPIRLTLIRGVPAALPHLRGMGLVANWPDAFRFCRSYGARPG